MAGDLIKLQAKVKSQQKSFVSRTPLKPFSPVHFISLNNSALQNGTEDSFQEVTQAPDGQNKHTLTRISLCVQSSCSREK